MELDIIDHDTKHHYVLYQDGIYRVPKESPSDYPKIDYEVKGSKLITHDPNFNWMFLDKDTVLRQQVDEFDPDSIEYVPVNPSKAWLDGRIFRRVLVDLTKVMAPVDAKEMVKAQPMHYNIVNFDSLSRIQL